MKSIRKTVSVILALILIFSFTLPAFADDTAIATTMRITEKEGTVTVKNASGKSVTVRNDMRLYSGYTVATEKDSTVYISLDDSKAIKLDSNSNISIKKNGKKLEVQVVSGSIFFNVTEPLKGDESLNIRTTTMVTGIRGTSGQASVMPAEVKLDKNGRPEADYLWDESVILFTGHAEITATKSTTVDGAVVSTDELIKGVEAEGNTGTAQPGTTGTITVEERKDAKSMLESIFKSKETVEVKVDTVDVEIFAGETVVSRSLGVEGNVEEFQVEKVSAVKEDISASALEEIIKDEDLQEKIAESSDLITNEEGQIDTTVLETLVEEKKEEEAIAVAEKEEAFEEAKEKIEIEAVDEHVFEPVVETEPANSDNAGSFDSSDNDYSDPDPTPSEPAPEEPEEPAPEEPEDPAPEEPEEDPTKIVLSGDHVDAQNYIAALKDETITDITVDGGRVELNGDNCEGDSAKIPEGKTVKFTNDAEFLVGQRVTFDVYGTLTFEEGSSFDNAGVINILSNNSVHIKSTHAAISGVIKIGSENASGLLDVEGSLVTAPGSNNVSIEIINGEICVGSTGVVASNIIVTGNGTKSGRGSVRYNEAPISMTVASGATATISEGRVYGVVCSNNATLTVNGGIIKQNDGLEGASSLDVQGGTVNLNSGSIENSNVNGFATTLSGIDLPNVTLGDNFVIRTKNYQDTPLQNTKWVDDSVDGWYRLVKYDYSNLDDPTYEEFVEALKHTTSVAITNLNAHNTFNSNDLTIENGYSIELKSGTLNNYVVNNGTLTISGAEVKKQIINNNKLIITDGTVSDTSNALNLKSGSTTTISGGTVTARTAIQIAAGATVNLNGGTIAGSEVGVIANGPEVQDTAKSQLTIDGSTISGNYIAVNANSSIITINSGVLDNNSAIDGDENMGTLVASICETTINGGTISNNQRLGKAIILNGEVTSDTIMISSNATIRSKNAKDYALDGFKYVPSDNNDGWYVLNEIDYGNLNDPTYSELTEAFNKVDVVAITNINGTNGNFTNSLDAGNEFIIPAGKTIELKSGTLGNNIANNGTLIVSGAEVNSQINNNSKLTISAGTVGGVSVNTPVILNSGSEATISGGTVTGNTGVYVSGAALTVTGGTVEGTDGSTGCAAINALDGSTVNISGGTVSGNNYAVMVNGEPHYILDEQGEPTNEKDRHTLLNISDVTTITGYKGAVYAENAIVEINGGLLENDPSGSDYMGVLYCNGCLTTINGGSIINNQTRNNALKIIGNTTTDLTTISESAEIKTKNLNDNGNPNGYYYDASGDWYILKEIDYIELYDPSYEDLVSAISSTESNKFMVSNLNSNNQCIFDKDLTIPEGKQITINSGKVMGQVLYNSGTLILDGVEVSCAIECSETGSLTLGNIQFEEVKVAENSLITTGKSTIIKGIVQNNTEFPLFNSLTSVEFGTGARLYAKVELSYDTDIPAVSSHNFATSNNDDNLVVITLIEGTDSLFNCVVGGKIVAYDYNDGMMSLFHFDGSSRMLHGSQETPLSNNDINNALNEAEVKIVYVSGAIKQTDAITIPFEKVLSITDGYDENSQFVNNGSLKLASGTFISGSKNHYIISGNTASIGPDTVLMGVIDGGRDNDNYYLEPAEDEVGNVIPAPKQYIFDTGKITELYKNPLDQSDNPQVIGFVISYGDDEYDFSLNSDHQDDDGNYGTIYWND